MLTSAVLPCRPERDGSTTTSRDVSREGSRHGPDFSTSEGSVPRSSIKRELHKASVAQELSDSVLQLLLEAPPGEWGLPLEARVRQSFLRQSRRKARWRRKEEGWRRLAALWGVRWGVCVVACVDVHA